MNRLLTLLSLGVFVMASGCAASAPPVNVSEGPVVDCRLPGEVRKLGYFYYMGPRRYVQTTARDCEIRGGDASASPSTDSSPPRAN